MALAVHIDYQIVALLANGHLVAAGSTYQNGEIFLFASPSVYQTVRHIVDADSEDVQALQRRLPLLNGHITDRQLHRRAKHTGKGRNIHKINKPPGPSPLSYKSLICSLY